MDGLMLQALVYLAAAVIAVPIAQRVGLGSVLGYLIAGCLIGPHLLGLVGDQTSVMHAAEFGVIILMFLIGLEMRPALLWRMKRVFALGAAHVLGTGSVLSLAGLLLGLDWRQAVAAGFILALSATAIVLQSLEEHGLRRQTPGRVGFGILLFEDLTVIPLFALLPLLAALPPPDPAEVAHGTALLHGAPGWLQAVATLAAVAAVLLAGRFLARPAFRFIAASRQREVFTVAALLIVVGVTALMQAVGLSPALGAFLAGVVLGDSEYRREIEADIEPFRGLFLGLFFITIGASIDLAAVAGQPLVVFGLVLGLIVIKALMLFGLVRLFRFETPVALAVAAALSQGSEFAFVLLAFSAAGGVLTPELASLLTIVVALSMAATPLVLLAYVRWAAAARRAPPGEPESPDFDDDHPAAIVAGYGRFGQIVARVLNTNGFPTTVLENSIEQIDLLRRFGRRVHYGDASRLDLLHAAGAERARLLVVAVDDREKALEIVDTAREAFPELKVLARAFDRRHAYELLERGAHVIERETFEGGLALAAEALKTLGWRAYRAERAARLFRRHDERMFEALREVWGDQERYTVAARESSPRMDDLIRADMARGGADPDVDAAWDVGPHVEVDQGKGRS